MAVINLAEYAYKLTLDSSEYSNSMKAAEEQAEKMKSRLSGVGDFLKTSLVAGMAAAGAAIVGTVVQGVKATAELDEQLSQFRASTAATAEETEKIRELSQELYKDNTDSMEDIVATATAMMQAMELTTDEVEKYQQKYMDYAKTTGQANTDVIAAIDSIGSAWGLTAEESAGSLDMLKVSSEEYATDISSLQSTLANAAPAAKALGLSLEETNGYINLFAESGLDASVATTAFTYAAKQVESPEQFKTMVEDIQAISDPTARAQAAVELFGSRAGVSLANALSTGTVSDFVITMDEASGAVTDASEAFDDNFNVQLELMKKQFLGLAQEIGQKFMPVLTDVMKWVSNNMPRIMGTIESTINFISGLIDPFIAVIRGIIGSFSDAEEQSDTSFNAIKEVISSVITTVRDIINTFITLFTAIWDKWGADIVAFAQNHFENIMSVIQNALDYIQNIVSFFTALFKGDWEGVFTAVKNIASSAWTLIKSIFKTAVDFLNGIINAGFTLMGTVVENLMELLWEGIQRVWENIVIWFEESIAALVEWFSSLGQAFLNIGSQLLSWVWEGMKGIWESISSWVSDKVDWLVDKLSFWRRGRDEMSRGEDFERESYIDGSHRTGLAYVPFDGYKALLHKGERVLTAQQNSMYSSNYNNPVNIQLGNIVIEGSADQSIVAQIKQAQKDAVAEALYKVERSFSTLSLDAIQKTYA